MEIGILAPGLTTSIVKILLRGCEGEWHSDGLSRGLSHHSTGTDAGGLDFRGRYGTGENPSAMAVHNSSFEFELICSFGQRLTCSVYLEI